MTAGSAWIPFSPGYRAAIPVSPSDSFGNVSGSEPAAAANIGSAPRSAMALRRLFLMTPTSRHAVGHHAMEVTGGAWMTVRTDRSAPPVQNGLSDRAQN